ncbi:hypothetical protein GOD53_31840 [Sinorhizobium medicae]|nr:hypothetical protein [Sinorhizobium medicae]MDX0748205.1 hypothetical protein [Sinorhizobium medicae]
MRGVARPTMRFVPVKSEEQQSVLILHRVRDPAAEVEAEYHNTASSPTPFGS